MSFELSSSQQFILAAEQLYPQLGYQKLSVRALASQAKLSSGLFHHLFANKDDFMAQVFAQHFQRAFGWLAPEFAADAPPMRRRLSVCAVCIFRLPYRCVQKCRG